MNFKFTFFKYCISLMLILATVALTNAQENPKYVCDVNTNTSIDLGIDVIGNVLSREGGYWDQVELSGGLTTVIDHDISNIFVLTGLNPGKYEFVYTATNNACMPSGTKDTATVIILQTPKDFSHIVYSCEGHTPTLDLTGILPAGFEDVPVSFSFVGTYANVQLSGASNLEMNDYTGTIYLQYVVDYTGDGATAELCGGAGNITLEVIRDDAMPTLTVSDALYCQEATPEKINLANLAGITAYENGRWELNSESTATGVSFSGNIISFNDVPPALGEYTFTYSWDGVEPCYGDGSANFVLVITDNLELPVAPKDSICLTDNPERIYNLTLEGLGMSLPVTAGKWLVDSIPTGQSFEPDVQDGLFRVGNVRPGSYSFIFVASDVAEICGLSGTTKLELTVGDIGSGTAEDGRIQLCVTDLETKTGNLRLSDFLLTAPEEANWTGPSGITITGANGDEVSYADLEAMGVGTYKFTFDYGSAGCAGSGEGYLYVTITDNLNLADNIELNFCRPDMPASLNLFQVIGADIEGSWDGLSSADNSFDLVNGIFTETPDTIGEKTYTLKLTGITAGCNAPDTITVTINIRDNSF
ncbi:MAG: hypothetical protein ACK5M7_04790 [Draconibacterium sp.]